MAEDVFGFSRTDARRIDDAVSMVLGSQPSSGNSTRPSDGQLPVVVTPETQPLELQWATSQVDVNTHEIDGDVWSDAKTILPGVRLISNGRQLALPVAGAGLCVQDPTFWAVNIGTLVPATHPLTGHSTGVAAVLKVLSTGNLEITDERLDFIRRDASGTVADGTLIQLGYVSGTLTCVWTDCASHVDLIGLEAVVAPPEPEP